MRAQMMEDAALHEQYTHVITPEPALNEETEDVCALLKECYDMRCAPSAPCLCHCLQQSLLCHLPYCVCAGRASWEGAWTLERHRRRPAARHAALALNKPPQLLGILCGKRSRTAFFGQEHVAAQKQCGACSGTHC